MVNISDHSLTDQEKTVLTKDSPTNTVNAFILVLSRDLMSLTVTLSVTETHFELTLMLENQPVIFSSHFEPHT